MKIDRLIGIITILLRQDKITAPELARRFEVSRRTINRDIEAICQSGIPLVTTQGRGGGISIAEGYKISSTLLTAEERQAVFAGLQGIDSISSSPISTALRERLSARSGCVPCEDTFTIDLASHYRLSLTQKMEPIKKAVRERRLLVFQYLSAKGEQRRVIEPYRLVFQWSAWYVWGYCKTREDFRMFKLNRLWNLEVSAETFPPRPLPETGFGPEFSGEVFHLKAVFAPEQRFRLVEEYGLDCCTRNEDGSLLLEREFVNYSYMREWVLSFGDSAYVLEPEQLRTDLRCQAENLLKAYRDT